MDATIRNMDEPIFRGFKARCAEIGISLGEGFNRAAKGFLKDSAGSPGQKKEVEADLHTLLDLSQHIHELRLGKRQAFAKK